MIPHTVPNSPTNGATEPTVASTFSRSASRSISVATAEPMTRPSRSRVPSRSTRPTVERRHSNSPAASTRTAGMRGSSSYLAWSASKSLARLNSRSNRSIRWRVRPSLVAKANMIAQVHTLAASSPIMTIFTTQSA